MKELYTKTIGAEGWLKFWALFILGFPYYVFPAGTPQPGDILISIVILFYIAKEGIFFEKSFSKHITYFRNLIVYIAIVNIILFLVRIGYKDKGLSLIVNLFYLFNFLLFTFSLSLYSKYKKEFIITTVYSVVLSALIQVALSPYGRISEGREALFFTNPNQLGYYALSGLTIVLALEKYLKISRAIVFVSFACFFYFTMLCVSKAAIGGMIILIGIYLISNKILTLRTFFTAAVVGVGLMAAIFKTNVGERFVRNLTYRLDYSVKPKDVSEWEYRGYDRMNNHPYYMILGAGEGAFNRFDTYIENHEMHSSLGTILFCYGIPGSIFFILFITSLLRGLPLTYSLYILPLIAYGVAHMGLRFTIFYIALAMFPVARDLIENGGFDDEEEKSENEEEEKPKRRPKYIKPLWMQNPLDKAINRA